MDALPELHDENHLTNRRWRLNNLYSIIDKDGHRIPFKLNWAQEALLDDLHDQNVF